MFWIALMFVLNLVISWSNAYVGGRNLRAASQVGGFPWLLNWCGIIMSGCGFTWCYMVILAGLGFCFGQLTHEHVDMCFKVGYIVLAPTMISTGFVITANSWIKFVKRRSLGNAAEVAWNTYAQARNTYNAFSFFPEALGDVADAIFGGKGGGGDNDGKGKVALLAIVVVVIALLLGVLTTRFIVLSAASTAEL